MTHDWGAIKANNPLAEIVGKVVQLKKVGNEYKGLCPFHAEKSPSFHVIPDKGFAHCFGCGWHGDVVDFVAATQHITNAEALSILDGGNIKLTQAERKDHAEALAQRDADRQRERAAATDHAAKRWHRAPEAGDDNGYILRKGVPIHGCRAEGENLLLPIYGPDGEIQSIQTIAPDGVKMFQKGAPTKGGRMMIGIPMGRTIICEGYATGASIYEAVPDQICIAFSKGNMHVVARDLVSHGVKIVLAADANAAEEMRVLAAELDCPVAIPDQDEGVKDFNDQATQIGADSVAASFAKAMKDYQVEKNPPARHDDGMPFDLDGIDLKSPPGFVGELTKWIDMQGRRPRSTIAVAAALTAMGNIAGLRYIDGMDGVTSNLFAFCIAGSRTGKEAMLQAATEIIRVAGFAAATHGSIKSEQEIVRNLIRHQAAFYLIDEVGDFLSKVKNAKTRGGASYLEGVVGTLMSVYSKANKFLLLTGDSKEEMRKLLTNELAQTTKKLDEGAKSPFMEIRLESIAKQLASIDNGIEKPFLSVMGFTTPTDFDEMVDYRNATNGFIGRSIIFNERDTTPRTKKNFVAAPMTEQMAATLRMIATGGACDMVAGARVEMLMDRIPIPTTSEAKAMLFDAVDWFDDQAVIHKGRNGLEALYMGAYELVSKVSLILAIPEGTRTAEHVRWAFALIARDVEEKMLMVTANDREKDAPMLAMDARLLAICSIEGGELASVIYNRMRGKSREDIDKALARLCRAGSIRSEDKTNPSNKKVVMRYHAIR